MEWCDNPFYLVKFVIASSNLGVFPILILVLHNTDQHLDLFLSWFLIAFDNFWSWQPRFPMVFRLCNIAVINWFSVWNNHLAHKLAHSSNNNAYKCKWAFLTFATSSLSIEVLIKSGARMAYLHNSNESESRPPLWKKPSP